MNKTVLIYSCVLLIGVLVSAISQVLLKKAAMKHYENHLKEYLNPMVIFAYAMFVGTTFLSIIAYRGIPLSMGPILEATSYIYVTIFGVKIFHERLNKKKIINIFISVEVDCGKHFIQKLSASAHKGETFQILIFSGSFSDK